ncbi:UDP-N-acetylglucosamine 1-carboxyvinyltransferase [soil metagenome]
MDSFLIRGGSRLKGKIEISGSKNSALPILAACLMAEGKTTLRAVPRLSDIDSMCKLLGELGCRVFRHDSDDSTVAGPALNGPLDIEVVDEKQCEARYDIVKTMRASICVLGPLLAKRGRVIASIPGGCAIGDRPVDLHLRGLQKLGAAFHTENGNIVGEVPGGRLRGCRMYLGGAQGPTVLGTINVMCAAALADGETVLVGAACEPEVSDCAELLIKMGARIRGHGTPEIRIEGVEHLRGVEHRIIPDRIEAGTFMIAAAITNGELELKNCNLDHLVAVSDRLDEVGVRIVARPEDGMVTVSSSRRLSPVEMTTQPFPGFPTDLQAQLMALLSLGDGMSVITERIFQDRYLHVGELNRMGARIRKEGATAIIQGVKELHGAPIMASDLRASAGLVLAALAARGETRIDRIYHIDRGYEKIEQKLIAVGADIRRVQESRTAAQSGAVVAA